MRKLVLVSTLILSSSIAFAQFTGPSVERESQVKRDSTEKMQERPRGNRGDRPCDAPQRMKSEGEHPRAEGSKRHQMHQEKHQRNGEPRAHHQYRHHQSQQAQGAEMNHRRGEMRERSNNHPHQQQYRHADSQREMHQHQRRSQSPQS